jgi:hypothetical protein
MRLTMAYMVALEDGEIVKLTAEGFESTGMFVVSIDGISIPIPAVSQFKQASANA